MISAVADSCSVRLDKVNGKVYKFHALVFNPGKFVSTIVIDQYIFPEELIEVSSFYKTILKASFETPRLTARGDQFLRLSIHKMILTRIAVSPNFTFLLNRNEAINIKKESPLYALKAQNSYLGSFSNLRPVSRQNKHPTTFMFQP